MKTSPAGKGNPLFSDAELDAMIVEIESVRAVPKARRLFVELREFHGWTLNKLEVFENYLKLYRRVAGGGAFIDAFAGTGRGLSINNGRHEPCDGSSLIAATSGEFSSMHLIEKDASNVDALTSEVKSLTTRQYKKIHIHSGDCNKVIPELLNSSRLDESRPSFALLDQESTQLDWRTVQTLASWKTYEPPPTMTGRPKICKIELWILFNSYQAINRLWPRDRDKYPESLSPQTLDRIFGGREEWWDLWQSHEPASALVFRFADQLRELGYQYVLPQLFNDRSSGRPQYYMLHATDHPSAVSFMRWAKRSTDGYENQKLPGL